MEKIAFLFPGQGSQFAGMGKALAAAHGSAQRVFEEADQALDLALSRLCFEGPEQEVITSEVPAAALREAARVMTQPSPPPVCHTPPSFVRMA